ncbi:hypothetical protein FB639_004836, partial [Coemansia asiatica]
MSQSKSKLKRPAGQAFEDNDGSDEDLDALRWIERSRQRLQEQKTKNSEKKPAKKQKTQLTSKYSADDLAGAKIAHSLADFAAMQAGTEEHVLTLQDKTIDEMEDGSVELQSIALAEAERAKKNADMRSVKLGQMGIETLAGMNRNSNAFSGDIEGGPEEQVFFTIQSGGTIDGLKQDQEASLATNASGDRGRIKVSFDSESANNATQLASDFYTETEAASLFKKPRKPKKSKKASKKTTTNDFAEIVDADKVNSLLTRESNIVDDSQFADDDDDLQKAISRVRRTTTGRAGRKKMGRSGEDEAKDIARMIRSEDQAKMDIDPRGSSASGSELVLSSTIEFVQALRSATDLDDAAMQPASAAADSVGRKEETKEEETKEETKEEETKEEETKEEGEAEAEAEALIIKGTRARQDTEAPASKHKPVAATAQANPPPLAEQSNMPAAAAAVDQPEQIFGTGLAATLSFLRQRNMLDKMTDEQKRFEQQQRSREAWIAEQRLKEAELLKERQRIKQMGRQLAQSPVSQQPEKGRRGKAD